MLSLAPCTTRPLGDPQTVSLACLASLYETCSSFSVRGPGSCDGQTELQRRTQKGQPRSQVKGEKWVFVFPQAKRATQLVRPRESSVEIGSSFSGSFRETHEACLDEVRTAACHEVGNIGGLERDVGWRKGERGEGGGGGGGGGGESGCRLIAV